MTTTNLKGTNRPLDIRKVPASKKKWSEADFITDAVGERSLRDAAKWLNAGLPEIFHRSHTSVANWINGDAEPDDVFLNALTIFYPENDPRHELSADLLASRERKAAKVTE